MNGPARAADVAEDGPAGPPGHREDSHSARLARLQPEGAGNRVDVVQGEARDLQTRNPRSTRQTAMV
jgi:hypothetical protein